VNLIYADLSAGVRTGGLTIMMRETETENENSVTKASQGEMSGDVQSLG